jgi:hypothetical protein
MASGPSSRRRPGFIENLSFFPFLVSSISSVFLLFLLSLSFSVARAQKGESRRFPRTPPQRHEATPCLRAGREA